MPLSKCKYLKSFFYSSGKVDGGQAFELNRRVVLASKNIGFGHQDLTKFAGVMNMLSPINENSKGSRFCFCNAAEIVARKSMTDAAEKVKQFYEPEKGDFLILECLEMYLTRRRRGYSSAYGVAAALSTVTGKALDVEVMSKECRECIGWRKKEATAEFQEW